MSQIFITYSHSDTPFLRVLLPLLKQGIQPHTIWYDEKLLTGDAWKNVIPNEITKSALLVYLMSNESLKSEWCVKEINLAKELGIPIFPVIVRKYSSDNIPRGWKKRLDGIQHIDLSADPNDADLVTRLIGSINEQLSNLLTLVSPEKKHLNTIGRQKHIDSSDNQFTSSALNQVPHQPLRFLDLMDVVEELEKAVDAVQTVYRSVKRTDIRASLMWSDTEEIYTAAATEGFKDFEEEELRLLLKPGQGIIGQFWNDYSKDKEIYQTKDYLGEKFESLNFSLEPKQKQKQMRLIRNISTIILYRILNEKGTIGVLVVEIKSSFKKRVSSLPDDFWKQINTIQRHIKNQIKVAYPLPYFKFQQLKSIVHMARLLPPYIVPVQAAIFWWDDEKKWLYMICGDQRYTGAWITETETWGEGEGVIGKVKMDGRFKAEDRWGKEDQQIMNDSNMNDKQFKTVKTIKSLAATPIKLINDGKEQIVGVLSLLSPFSLEESELDKVENIVNEFAKIAASIYQTKSRDIGDEPLEE